jgi:protein translocase SecG subunit
MHSILTILSIISSVFVIVLILMQRANTDAGGAFTSDSNSFKRRGAEKNIYRATIFFSVLFAASLAAMLFI